MKPSTATIAIAVKPFTIGAGGRIVYLDVYSTMRDRYMRIAIPRT